MKEIHKLLKISPEQWDLISNEEKINLIINYLMNPQGPNRIGILNYIENSIYCLGSKEFEVKGKKLRLFEKERELRELLENEEYSHCDKLLAFKNSL